MSKKIKDRSGIRYGRLTAIKYVGLNKFNRAEWLCECSCGNTKIVDGGSLSNKSTTSCGCYNGNKGNKGRPAKKNREKVLLRVIYNRFRYKNGWSIDFDDFCDLVRSECYYCGKKSSMEVQDRITDFILKYNSIVKLNIKDDGYTKNNSVSCCSVCKQIKYNLSNDEFYSWLDRVNNNQLKWEIVVDQLESLEDKNGNFRKK